VLAAGARMQLDAMVELIRNCSPEQFTRAPETWSWIGTDGKSPGFTSPFGDVFFRSADGFWWLDTLESTLTRRWTDTDELKAARAIRRRAARHIYQRVHGRQLRYTELTS
jgi:hypothetical protein